MKLVVENSSATPQVPHASQRLTAMRGTYTLPSQVFLSALLLLASASLHAQQGTQPPPFTAPNPPTPAATDSPGQQAVPAQQTPQVAPDAPLPQPDQTTVDLRDLAPLAPQPASPAALSAGQQRVGDTSARPEAESPSRIATRLFTLAPYRAARVPALPAGSTARMDSLVHDGKLYLSLHDAIALAIENNLDVEVSRYNLLAADTDIVRAQGGGNLRGLDYTIQETPAGVGALTSPLLVTATTGNPTSTNTNVTDLSQITQSGSGTQQNLSENNTSTFSAGPTIPVFDPTLSAQAGYLRRSDQVTLVSATTTTTASTAAASNTPPQDYISTGIDYQQGFRTGAQIDAYVDNAAQVLYAGNSQYNPFHAPSTSFTITQPLLRGRGSSVNTRFIRVARLNKKVSEFLFEQQLLETIYGVSRLYYDLVSLGENIGVQEEALAAAERLYQDDKDQVDEGTLAPIELTRAQALRSSSRLNLIQARGEYRQQESILREQLLRRLGGPGAGVVTIVATDRISVPDNPPALDVPALTTDALANRPDLAQAGFQIQADEAFAGAAGNNAKPLLNVYANVQTRGSSLVPYTLLGSPGTGSITVPPALTQGGLRLETVYQAGVQLNLPLRNRIAQADSARDTIQARQAEGRSLKLENDIRQQIESASIALENAHQAYAAAVESRNFQQQLLQAEKDKFSVGESTNFLIIQDQAYLAQARSTEVAARSDWMKAQMSLDRALGNLLEKNGIVLDEAIHGQLK